MLQFPSLIDRDHEIRRIDDLIGTLDKARADLAGPGDHETARIFVAQAISDLSRHRHGIITGEAVK